MTEISETEIKSMTKEQNYMRGYRDGKSDVLDKIRAEIEKPLHDERCFDTADAKAQYIALNWVCELIDKHIKEIEDMGDYPDEIPNQFDNLTGSMNV